MVFIYAILSAGSIALKGYLVRYLIDHYESQEKLSQIVYHTTIQLPYDDLR